MCEALDTAAGVAANVMWQGWAAGRQAVEAGGAEASSADGQGGGGSDEDGSAAAQWEALPAEQRLGALLRYLRAPPHLYCLYCGSRFADESDMADSCPGPLEEDHGG